MSPVCAIDFIESSDARTIAGVDEVGRGALAGPVTATAVILGNNTISGLADSKKLTPVKRSELAAMIEKQAMCWSVGWASVAEIDSLNILGASLLAMKRAVEGLSITPDLVLVDGLHCPDLAIDTRAVVKGDQRVCEISASSILAKVYRDAEMLKLDSCYSGYGFSKHKGYPTRAHIKYLDSLGVSGIHRRSYKPVSRLI